MSKVRKEHSPVELVARYSNYGSNKTVILKMDEASIGTVIDAIGNMTEEKMQALGLNEDQQSLLYRFYRQVAEMNWYVEGLGK